MKNEEVFNTSVAKLRVIYKNENSYEEMKDQVDKLVESDKSNLCKKIIELVVPNDLCKKIANEINEKYDLAFENQWRSEKLYKEAYKAYITELKQLAKSLKKGDNK